MNSFASVFDSISIYIIQLIELPGFRSIPLRVFMCLNSHVQATNYCYEQCSEGELIDYISVLNSGYYLAI